MSSTNGITCICSVVVQRIILANKPDTIKYKVNYYLYYFTKSDRRCKMADFLIFSSVLLVACNLNASVGVFEIHRLVGLCELLYTPLASGAHYQKLFLAEFRLRNVTPVANWSWLYCVISKAPIINRSNSVSKAEFRILKFSV